LFIGLLGGVFDMENKSFANGVLARLIKQVLPLIWLMRIGLRVIRINYLGIIEKPEYLTKLT